MVLVLHLACSMSLTCLELDLISSPIQNSSCHGFLLLLFFILTDVWLTCAMTGFFIISPKKYFLCLWGHWKDVSSWARCFYVFLCLILTSSWTRYKVKTCSNFEIIRLDSVDTWKEIRCDSLYAVSKATIESMLKIDYVNFIESIWLLYLIK